MSEQYSVWVDADEDLPQLEDAVKLKNCALDVSGVRISPPRRNLWDLIVIEQVARTVSIHPTKQIAEVVLPEVLYDACYDPEVLSITCDLKIWLPEKTWREMGVRRMSSTPIRVTVNKESLKADIIEFNLAPAVIKTSASLPATRTPLTIADAVDGSSVIDETSPADDPTTVNEYPAVDEPSAVNVSSTVDASPLDASSLDASPLATPNLSSVSTSSSHTISSVASTTSFRFSPTPESPGSPASTASSCLSPSDLDRSEVSSCAVSVPVAVIHSGSVPPRSSSASPTRTTSTSGTVSALGRSLVTEAAPAAISTTLRLYDFEEISYLSHGSFGMVHLVQHRDTRTECALKSICKEPDVERAVRKEQHILHKLRGTRHVLDLLASFHDEVNYYLITVRGLL